MIGWPHPESPKLKQISQISSLVQAALRLSSECCVFFVDVVVVAVAAAVVVVFAVVVVVVFV